MHASGDDDSAALAAAQTILDSRGAAPRLYRNALVFLAADKLRHQDLDAATRLYLAWRSILDDRERLDLPPHQVRQTEQQIESANGTIDAQINETFVWLLIPAQKSHREQRVEWKTIRMRNVSGPLAKQASRRLESDETLVTSMAGTRLRMELDRVPLWRGNHVSVQQLVEDFARYIYLPRLRQPSVLLDAIRDGVALLTWMKDSFAYADSYDEKDERYPGLRINEQGLQLTAMSPGLVVKADVARPQWEREKDPVPDPKPNNGGGGTGPGPKARQWRRHRSRSRPRPGSAPRQEPALPRLGATEPDPRRTRRGRGRGGGDRSSVRG